MDDEEFMLRAIELSREAAESGNEPFGAVLVRDGHILMESGNITRTAHDPTGHAELHLIRRYCTENEVDDMQNVTMYCNVEPCFMCSGAMAWAKLGRLVFAAFDRDYQAVRGLPQHGSCTEVFNVCALGPKVRAGVMRRQAIKVLRDYWKTRI